MVFEKSAAAKSALNLTRKIVSSCGVRFAGTESCNRAGEKLQEELDRSCDHTHLPKNPG